MLKASKTVAAVLAAACLLPGLVAAPAEAPKPVTPVNLAVNTKHDEDEPHLADRGLTLFYAGNGGGKWDILVSERRKLTQPWPKGKAMEDFLATLVDDRSTFATAGPYPHFLYYATKKNKEVANFDLYVAAKRGAGKAFAAPAALHALCTEADELHPWLTADGKQLYFSRKTGDGWRVFVAARPKAEGAGGWLKPALLKELPADFHHATLTPDGKTMYLQGPLGKGRWGLFVATKGASGWGKPAALEALNHPDGKTGDRSPNLSRDGAALYFASDRPGGKGGLDLYVTQTALLKKK